MKALGSPVTFVGRNSALIKLHVQRHERLKPYVCIECPKRFYTAHELKRHQLIRLEVKRFACRLCLGSKSLRFKRKVSRHFKGCASNLVCSDMSTVDSRKELCPLFDEIEILIPDDSLNIFPSLN